MGGGINKSREKKRSEFALAQNHRTGTCLKGSIMRDCGAVVKNGKMEGLMV